MKVKLTTATYWDGKRLKTGDTINVAKDVAERWEDAGIAKITEEKAPGEKTLDRMTTDELTQKAAVLGVDISGATTNKQRAEIIQAFIDSDDDDQQPEDDPDDENTSEE